MSQQKTSVLYDYANPDVHLLSEELVAVATARTFDVLSDADRTHLAECRPCLYLLERIATLLRTHRKVIKDRIGQ